MATLKKEVENRVQSGCHHLLGFSDKFLAGLEEHLQPGTSALAVLAEHQWVVKLSEALAHEEGVMLQQTLTDELVEYTLASGGAEE